MGISIKDIEDDKFSGSFELSQNSLNVFFDFIKNSSTKDPNRLVDECIKFAKEIIKSQPNMVTIRKKVSTVVYHMKRSLKADKSNDEIINSTKAKIKEIIRQSESRKKNIGNIGAKLIFNNNKILTISSSSLVKEIFLSAHKLKRKFTVYCLESRPQNEGHLLANELSDAGISCVLTTDAMMGQVLNEVNMIVCGADRLSESGFVNKTGTLPLAVNAKGCQVPLYVTAETDKILKELDRSIRFYPQNPDEVLKKRNKMLSVSNYYFELVPFEYVSKVICEDGVFDTNEFITWYLKD